MLLLWNTCAHVSFDRNIPFAFIHIIYWYIWCDIFISKRKYILEYRARLHCIKKKCLLGHVEYDSYRFIRSEIKEDISVHYMEFIGINSFRIHIDTFAHVRSYTERSVIRSTHRFHSKTHTRIITCLHMYPSLRLEWSTWSRGKLPNGNLQV